MKVSVVSIHPLNDNRILRHITTLLDDDLEVEYINASDSSFSFDSRVKVKHLNCSLDTHSPFSFLKVWRYIRNELKHSDSNIIHVHDIYLLPAVISISKKKVLFDRHERFEIIESLLARLFIAFEKIFIRGLSACAYTVEAEKEYLKKIGYKHLAYVPNFQSEKTFAKAQSDLRRTGNEQRHLVYIGSLSNYDRNITLLLDVFEQAMDARNDIRCTLGGKASDATIIQRIEALQRNHPERFEFLGYCTHDIVVQKSIESDIGFLFFRDFPNTRYSSPNKLYEYLLSGTIFVGVGKFILENEIVENGAGFIFDFDTECNELLKTIFSLCDDIERLNQMKQNAIKLGGNYTWEHVENRYIELYQAMLQ